MLSQLQRLCRCKRSMYTYRALKAMLYSRAISISASQCCASECIDSFEYKHKVVIVNTIIVNHCKSRYGRLERGSMPVQCCVCMQLLLCQYMGTGTCISMEPCCAVCVIVLATVFFAQANIQKAGEVGNRDLTRTHLAECAQCPSSSLWTHSEG